MPASGRAALLTCTAMLAVAGAAWYTPRLAYQDALPDVPAMVGTPAPNGNGAAATCGEAGPVFGPFPCARLPEEAVRRLKVQAHRQTKLAPLFYIHVADIQLTGPTPDHVAGRVVWRTIFGAPVGETTFSAGGASSTWDPRPGFLVWGALLVAEFGLASLLVWQLWTMP